jgi:crossover junction endodeoxyribonuclease RuvC
VAVSLIVGIDPGSRITGYGVIERRGAQIGYVDSGIIRCGSRDERPERLRKIKSALDDVLERHHPDSLAVEKIFVSKNPRSTLTLGEVRGVVILAAAEAGIPVFEYSPREVKNSVVGKGAAQKGQVAAMIGRLLEFDREPETEDETDALAVAFCHGLRESGAMREYR